jgi:hypothetical protein
MAYVFRVTFRRLSLLPALAGAALVLVGVLVGPPGFAGAQGAYFTRAAGIPSHSRAFIAWGEDSLLSGSDGNLWLGAGIACLAIALAALAAHAAGLRLVRERASGG